MKATRMALLVLMAFVVLGVFAGPGFVEAYILAGGPIGFVILFMSFISLALIIEHIVNIKRDKIVPPQLIDEIEGMFDNEEYQEALELCEAEPNYLTNILAAGLPKINAGFETMKASMDEAAEEEAVKLQQKIGYLSLIGNIAPMMGLFGTVSGMIKAFETIAKMGAAVTPSDLAEGISQALVTTFLGLLVAIPTMIAYFFFRNKVIRVSIEIAAIADDLVDRFRGK
ncbi:MAG: MotA/TolQ/ExbB proton channel family protein [Planctomycetota bacterium]|jgi:biopolymer transport protein ExbB